MTPGWGQMAPEQSLNKIKFWPGPFDVLINIFIDPLYLANNREHLQD